jgi:hypothetical protein
VIEQIFFPTPFGIRGGYEASYKLKVFVDPHLEHAVVEIPLVTPETMQVPPLVLDSNSPQFEPIFARLTIKICHTVSLAIVAIRTFAY